MFKFQNSNFKNNSENKNRIKNIYIVYGGPSSEREVSFSSKEYFLELYKNQKPIMVEWLEDFRFKVFLSGYPKRSGGSHPLVGSGFQLYDEQDFYHKISKENCVVIIAGHGEYIEDGYIQKKLTFHKIPFTGSNSVSCRLAMDKYASQLIASKFVKTIPTYKCSPKNFNKQLFLKKINKFPVFVKPNALGSSVGCYITNSQKDLEVLLENLHSEASDYLFQKCIEGIELSAGSVRHNSGFLNLPPTEIKPKVGSFFSWDAKYAIDGSEEITPSSIGDSLNLKVGRVANKIHNALDLGYYSRSDFILTKQNELYYLETNSYPGMSKTSLLPQQLEVSKNIENFKVGLLSNLIR